MIKHRNKTLAILESGFQIGFEMNNKAYFQCCQVQVRWGRKTFFAVRSLSDFNC